MKRLLPILTILAWVVLGVVSIGSDCAGLGGAPTNLKVEAATDSTVKLSWTAPAEGTPDKYIVLFKDVRATSFTEIDTTKDVSVIHNPQGATGHYKVKAKFGSNEYESDVVSTVPVATTTKTLAELNAAGSSGYGWYRSGTDAGKAATFSMTQAANAANVDVYLTDFATGYTGTEYCIASPDIARGSDPGAAGVVPEGAWRVNAIAKGITDENAPLPAHSATVYAQYQEIDQTPFLIAVYTADKYYALLKIESRNTGDGTVQVSSWFQLIPQLRLIKH